MKKVNEVNNYKLKKIVLLFGLKIKCFIGEDTDRNPASPQTGFLLGISGPEDPDVERAADFEGPRDEKVAVAVLEFGLGKIFLSWQLNKCFF